MRLSGRGMAAACATTADRTAEAGAVYVALMRRADALAGCAEGSEEGIELKAAPRQGVLAGMPWPQLQIGNGCRSTPKTDGPRLTLCATS